MSLYGSRNIYESVWFKKYLKTLFKNPNAGELTFFQPLRSKFKSHGG